MRVAPHSGESQTAVVPVTLRDSVLVVGVSMRCKLRSLVYSISGLVAEYIVAIDVTRVRFPADAQAKPVMLVYDFTQRNRVAELVITVAKPRHFREGGSRGGQPEVATMLGPPVPCMLHHIPVSPKTAVVPVPLRDSVLVGRCQYAMQTSVVGL